MKALHTLLPLVLLPTLSLTEITQLQAGNVYEEPERDQSFTFDRAVWRHKKDLLVLRGTGTPGAQIDTYIAGTDLYLGSSTVDSKGYWRFKSYNLASVPCGVQAINGNFAQEMVVARAPADCVSSDETPPDDPTPVENTPPVISGSPDTNIAEGQAYNFVPNASDAEGDSLTFSIENQPSWASFNASTANFSSIPPSSYKTLPGLMVATQYSGLPLPLPILVSAGFLVIGLSGKTRIHI
jgi:hypothetical protein